MLYTIFFKTPPLIETDSFVKPKPRTMKQLLHNDSRYIAEQFFLSYDHVIRTSQLASYKINSYKLSLKSKAFCNSRIQLHELISKTLLRFTPPATICRHENDSLTACLN